MKYKLITSYDEKGLANQVNEFLADRWELYGNPIIVTDNSDSTIILGQAMIKKSRYR